MNVAYAHGLTLDPQIEPGMAWVEAGEVNPQADHVAMLFEINSELEYVTVTTKSGMNVTYRRVLDSDG